MKSKRYCTESVIIKLPMNENHLKHLRGLTQFERCWTVIDSHLKLYKMFDELLKEKAVLMRDK
jgi:hypothetical protein